MYQLFRARNEPAPIPMTWTFHSTFIKLSLFQFSTQAFQRKQTLNAIQKFLSAIVQC